MRKWFIVVCIALMTGTAEAQEPADELGLFEGMQFQEALVGVQAVAVREDSQAYGAGLRVGDRIVRLNEEPVESLSGFLLKAARTSIADKATMLVYRHGEPQSMSIDRYSYPVRDRWGVKLKPNLELRFGEPDIGSYYWIKQAVEMESQKDWEQAVYAYWNALHHQPDQPALLLTIAELQAKLGNDALDRAEPTRVVLQYFQKTIVLLRRLLQEDLDATALQRVSELLAAASQSVKALSQ